MQKDQKTNFFVDFERVHSGLHLLDQLFFKFLTFFEIHNTHAFKRKIQLPSDITLTNSLPEI